MRPDGEVIRYGAGPALILSFVLLGVVCGARRAVLRGAGAMIPQAGSAYAYSYATLGELVAWIIGWDLILEYAVGNIAVADRVGRLLHLAAARLRHRPAGLADARLPDGAAQRRSGGARRCWRRRRGSPGMPILVNLPAFAHRDARSPGCCCIGVRESARANNIMVVDQAAGAGAVRRASASMHIDPANYVPFAPNGWRRHPSGRGDRVLRLHRLRRDLDRGRGDEEPAAQPADRHSRRAGHLHASSTSSSAWWPPGMVPYSELRAADPLARALELAGLHDGGLDRRRSARSCR